MAVSAFVDSASPGRNDVDSFFSASVNLPGRLAANEPTIASSQIGRDDPLRAAAGEDGEQRRTRADFYRIAHDAYVSRREQRLELGRAR